MYASEGGGPDQSPGEDGDMGMAPVDLDQAMGSFSPEWGNDTVSEWYFVNPQESVLHAYKIHESVMSPSTPQAEKSIG